MSATKILSSTYRIDCVYLKAKVVKNEKKLNLNLGVTHVSLRHRKETERKKKFSITTDSSDYHRRARGGEQDFTG